MGYRHLANRIRLMPSVRVITLQMRHGLRAGWPVLAQRWADIGEYTLTRLGRRRARVGEGGVNQARVLLVDQRRNPPHVIGRTEQREYVIVERRCVGGELVVWIVDIGG